MGIYGHGWGTIVGMFLFWALVLGVGLWLLARLFPAAWAVRVPQQHESHTVAADPAMQVVRQQYASGELSKHEYEEMLRILERTTVVGNSPQEI